MMDRDVLVSEILERFPQTRQWLEPYLREIRGGGIAGEIKKLRVFYVDRRPVLARVVNGEEDVFGGDKAEIRKFLVALVQLFDEGFRGYVINREQKKLEDMNLEERQAYLNSLKLDPFRDSSLTGLEEPLPPYWNKYPELEREVRERENLSQGDGQKLDAEELELLPILQEVKRREESFFNKEELVRERKEELARRMTEMCQDPPKLGQLNSAGKELDRELYLIRLPADLVWEYLTEYGSAMETNHTSEVLSLIEEVKKLLGQRKKVTLKESILELRGAVATEEGQEKGNKTLIEAVNTISNVREEKAAINDGLLVNPDPALSQGELIARYGLTVEHLRQKQRAHRTLTEKVLGGEIKYLPGWQRPGQIYTTGEGDFEIVRGRGGGAIVVQKIYGQKSREIDEVYQEIEVFVKSRLARLEEEDEYSYDIRVKKAVIDLTTRALALVKRKYSRDRTELSSRSLKKEADKVAVSRAGVFGIIRVDKTRDEIETEHLKRKCGIEVESDRDAVL